MDLVGQCEPCMHLRHIVAGNDSHLQLVRGLFVNSQRSQVHHGIAPHLQLLLHPGTHIVVGYRAPEVGPQRAAFTQQVNTVHLIVSHQSRFFIKSNSHIFVADQNHVSRFGKDFEFTIP